MTSHAIWRNAAFIGVAMSACTLAEVGSEHRAVIGGSETSADPAVVALVERAFVCSPDPAHAFCTGVLVGDKAVLTAAHCLDAVEPHGIAVVFGADAAAAETRNVVSGVAHAGFDRATGDNDIAVLALESAAPVEPMRYNTSALDSSLVGTTLRVVGFGDDGTLATGIKRTGTMTLTEVNTMDLRMVQDTAITCAGDSGGPVLADLGDGEVVVGITAWGDPACTEFGVAPRIDAYVDTFLTQTISDAELPTRPRAAFDVNTDFCSKGCAGDHDCPDGTVCIVYEQGTRTGCALGGLPVGNFRDACDGSGFSEECQCMGTPAGCRCFDPCGTDLDEPDPTDDSEDAGCSISSSPRGGTALLWCIMGLMLLRRPRRRGLFALALACALCALVACGADKKSNDSSAKAPMTIKELQPKALHAKGGQIMHIVGENFDAKAKATVMFGDQAAPRAAVLSATKLQVELPPGKVGTKVKVTVSQPTRTTATAPTEFSYLGDVH